LAASEENLRLLGVGLALAKLVVHVLRDRGELGLELDLLRLGQGPRLRRARALGHELGLVSLYIL